ncbi:hypothetical protein NCC78_04510 [Micromonospora phytophila]|uniref:glycerophosphodiester phosphodiesterase n=1 Tax=Micromonospora phytophila TaxID=709888 RepID=UPI00202EF39F|nr:glycerophosphodiester phosphodiesterase family protein [Micromonospora phytophila]MCM0673968.1 hypothetical protein [Micromonospora phytophila]
MTARPAGDDDWRTITYARKPDRHGGAGLADWQVPDPQGTVSSTDWYLRPDPAYLHGPDVRALQRRYGLTVVAYTVNDAAVMRRVIDLGVDGIVTDDPDPLVTVAIRNGLR